MLKGNEAGGAGDSLHLQHNAAVKLCKKPSNVILSTLKCSSSSNSLQVAVKEGICDVIASRISKNHQDYDAISRASRSTP